MAKGSKERTTVNFDSDIYEMVLALRAKPEYARMSVSALVNMLLERALAELKNPDQRSELLAEMAEG